jgi:hypothetical protein
VALLWAADTNTIAVLVRDVSTNDQFELLMEPDTNPIDVYQHPYAHSARRIIDYRTTNLQEAA